MSVQVAKTIIVSWFYVQMLRSGPDQFRALQQIRFCCLCLFQGTVFVDCRSLFFFAHSQLKTGQFETII